MATSRQSGLAAVLCALAAAGPADAADWSVGGVFSQRLEADTNVDLDDGSATGGSFGTITDIGISISARTPTTVWRLTPGVRGSAFSDSDFDANSIRPRFNGSVAHSRPRLGLNASLSFVPRLTNFDEREVGLVDADPDAPDAPDAPLELDERIVSQTALELALRGSAGASYQLDQLRSINGSAFVRRRDFVGGGPQLSDSLSFGGNLGYRRAVDPLSGVSLTGGVQWFTSENQSDRQSYSLRLGFDRRLSPRVSGSASAGLRYASGSDDGDAVGFTGGASLRYRGRQSNAGLRLFQGLDQNEFGDLENRTTLSGNVSHALDQRSSVSLSSSLSFDNPLLDDGGDSQTSFSISPRYTLRLAPSWRLGAGYQFRARDIDESRQTSHLVFVQISRGLTLLP